MLLTVFAWMSYQSLMPVFSVVIPTRARSDTLRHALRTVVAQPEQDLEIIVHQSGDDPATAAVLAEFDDRRIRAFKTGEPVGMTENWERALQRATGEYILFLGDDDGLLLDACTIARHILTVHSTEVLFCRPALYFWPDYFDTRFRDRLFSFYGADSECVLKDSHTALGLIYRFRRHFSELPMIYHSFVARKLIERVYKSRSNYFLESMPDVSSAIVNLCFSEHFIRFNRPLCISGMSRHSTNARGTLSGIPELQSAAISEYGRLRIHPTMVPSHNHVLVVANALIIAKDELFPNTPPEFDYAAMLQHAVKALSEVPDQYELELAHCRAVAEKNGIGIDESDVGPGGPPIVLPPLGRHEIAPGVLSHTLDGQSVGVQNVFDATRVFDGLLPKLTNDLTKFTVEPTQLDALAFEAAKSTALNFSASGNGALLLGPGWSTVEDWGVWSMAPRAELVLPVTGPFRGALKLVIHGQIFHPPRTLRVRIEQQSRILYEREACLSTDVVALEPSSIELLTDNPADELRIVFAIDRCISPAELGVSADTRKLGFGLRRIEISAASDDPSAGRRNTTARSAA
jgi:hypothetical protein